jgi:hypothetical protein
MLNLMKREREGCLAAKEKPMKIMREEKGTA